MRVTAGACGMIRQVLLGIPAAALLLTGCAANPTPPRRNAPERRCAVYAPGPTSLPRPAMAAADQVRFAALGYSPVAQRAAHAVGVEPLLLKLTVATAHRASLPIRLQLRHQLSERLMQGQLDTAAAVAELDCEGERADRLRRRLEVTQNRAALRYGVAGLLLGAGTAAVSGGLSLLGAATASSAAGISGGLAEAGAGGGLLFMAAPKGELPTPRNPLREVWDRPAESQIFPLTVWLFLNQPDAQGRTALDLLQAEWRTSDLLGDPGSAEEAESLALLMGKGGDYTADQLEVRGILLDLLEASVALLHQDLRILLREIRGRGLFGEDMAKPH